MKNTFRMQTYLQSVQDSLPLILLLLLSCVFSFFIFLLYRIFCLFIQ